MTISDELRAAVTRYMTECSEHYTRTFDSAAQTGRRPEYTMELGRKFIRIWCGFHGETGRSCHAFVVIQHPKFATGDLLLPATWKAPALNAARGNVLVPSSYIPLWTGPSYLR